MGARYIIIIEGSEKVNEPLPMFSDDLFPVPEYMIPGCIGGGNKKYEIHYLNLYRQYHIVFMDCLGNVVKKVDLNEVLKNTPDLEKNVNI